MKTHQKGFAGIAALVAVLVATVVGGGYAYKVMTQIGPDSTVPFPVETVKVEPSQPGTQNVDSDSLIRLIQNSNGFVDGKKVVSANSSMFMPHVKDQFFFGDIDEDGVQEVVVPLISFDQQQYSLQLYAFKHEKGKVLMGAIRETLIKNIDRTKNPINSIKIENGFVTVDMIKDAQNQVGIYKLGFVGKELNVEKMLMQ